jgi:hypothetical protein
MGRWTHFDNRENQTGMDLFIYCDVGFELGFSPSIWGVVDPRGGVAKWVAIKGFAAPANRLREIQKLVNTTLAIPSPGHADNAIETLEHKGYFKDW